MSGAVAPVDVAIKVKGLSELQKLSARMEALEKEITRLQGKLPKAANGIAATGRAAKGAAGGVNVFGAALKSAVAPLALVLGSVTSLTVGFQQLSTQDFAEAKFRSLGGDSDKLVQSLKALSRELGGQASTVELTGAAYDVASAGFSNAADATKVLKAASLGATGGFSDINTVANATTSVLNAYGLSADKAGRLVDGFIQTQNDGKIVIGEYANNIGKLAPIAASLGVPLEDINGAIAAVTANGINAEIGITALRSALAKLGSNSKEATDLLASYGVEINATTIGNEGLLNTLKKLQKVTDKTDLLKIIGTEAGQAIAPLLNDLGKLERLIANQGNVAGVAANAQKEAANTIKGAYTEVQTAFSNLFSEQSELATAIIPILQGVAAAVEALNSPLGGAILQVGLLTAGFIALKAAVSALIATSFVQWFGPIVGAVKAGNVVFAAFILKTKALTLAQAALNTVMSAAPWALLAGGLIYVGKGALDARTKIDALEASLRDTTGTGEALKTKMQETADKIETLKGQLDKAGPSADYLRKKIELLTVSLNQMKGRYEIEVLLTGNSDLSGLTTKGYKNTKSGLTYEVSGVEYNAATGLPVEKKKPKPMDTALTGGGPSGGPSGGAAAAAPKTDNLEALQRQLDLTKDLITFEAQRNKELLAGNDIAVAQIDGQIALRELQASGIEALAGMNTEEGKILQTQQNQLDVARQMQSAEALAATAALAKATAIKDALRPLKEQKRILEATLNGRGEEERMLINIENIMKGLPENQQEAVKALVLGNAELRKQGELQAKQAAQLDNLYKGIGSTIQNGIVDAIGAGIDGLINGTKDLGESLQEIASGVLKDIGKQLLSFGVKLGLQALSGGSPLFAAEGAYVTGPTSAVVGEGGEPEYIIPESKMRESMGRYSRGSRGNSVIPADGGGSAGTEDGGTATLAPIDVRYTVERINSVDYVTADQFQAGMRQATQQGAAQGENRALAKLRNSPGARRRIGL